MISDFEIILGNPRRYHFNIEAQDGKLKPAVVRDKNIFCTCPSMDEFKEDAA